MVAGVDFIHNLGLNEKDLVPVAKTVKAANKTDIKMIGAVIIEAKLNSPGVDKITKQIVFISPMASRPYLNLEACKQLGLVPDGFPKFTLEGISVNSLQDADILVSSVSKEPDTTCDYKVRTKPHQCRRKSHFLHTRLRKSKHGC